MSFDFRPLKTISARDLFDGRLKARRIREHIAADTTEQKRCLTDGRSYVWVHIGSDGIVGFTEDFTEGPTTYILDVIRDVFNAAIVGEHEPQYWGFDTHEEWFAYEDKLLREATKKQHHKQDTPIRSIDRDNYTADITVTDDVPVKLKRLYRERRRHHPDWWNEKRLRQRARRHGFILKRIVKLTMINIRKMDGTESEGSVDASSYRLLRKDGSVVPVRTWRAVDEDWHKNRLSQLVFIPDIEMHQMRMTRRKLTAYHEAGHAVAHLVMARALKFEQQNPIEHVTCLPSQNYEGYCKISSELQKNQYSHTFHWDPKEYPKNDGRAYHVSYDIINREVIYDRTYNDLKPVSEEYWLNLMRHTAVASLAGPSARAIASKRSFMKVAREHSGSDWGHATNILESTNHIRYQIGLPNITVEEVGDEVNALVRREWRSIDALAKALLKWGSLSGDKVFAIAHPLLTSQS